MARIDIAPLTQWITAAALQHGSELPAALMARLSISRRRANGLLRKLEAMQWLQISGTTRRLRYSPGALRQVVQRYALTGLQEDQPWRQDFAPFFALPPSVQRMVQHAFTELLNNAIDHSGGTQVTVSMRQTPLQVQLLVSDDGCGVFDRIAQSFAITDPQLAMLELSKGKLSSAPDRHSGHGLFFSSRLADVFDIHANAAAFQCRSWEQRPWRSGRPAARLGTSIYLAIQLDTPRTLDAVLRAHSLEGGYQFDRTEVPLHLLGGEARTLASRADARRVAARLGGFRRAELSFDGVDDIGHGFADELFRVFQRDNPGLLLVPVGMNRGVQAMVASVGPAMAAGANPMA
jgi:anti-sigma regulatory factor (Ser/Thr protein kinase)